MPKAKHIIKLKKDRTIAGEKTDNHKVLINGAFVGVIGRATVAKDSDYVFILKAKSKADRIKLGASHTIKEHFLTELRSNALHEIKRALNMTVEEHTESRESRESRKPNFARAKPTNLNCLLNCPMVTTKKTIKEED